MVAFPEDSNAVLARNSEAVEMGYIDGMPDGVLELSRTKLEGIRDDPEMTVRLLQASYEAAVATVQDFLQVGSSRGPAAH